MREICVFNLSLFIKLLYTFLLLCYFIADATGIAGAGAVPSLLFVTQEDIRLVSNRPNSKPKVQVLVRNLTEGVGLDINYAAQKICWTDHGLEMIQCVSYNGVEVENKVEVITTDLITPDGLACDWFTNKLYWTDSDTNKIEVATLNGEHRKVLIWSDIDQPRTIALVPMSAIMFWTDWGEVPKIERAGMNGDPATRTVIVSENIFWPNGLTVDYHAELLYWIDGKLKFIDVMNYDGKNRRTLIEHASDYPFALTQFQNKLYWTDWQTSFVYTVEKNSTGGAKELILSNQMPMYIQTWEASRQPIPSPGQNPCAANNGGCSHLCLLAPYPPGYTCACPIGIRLLNNLTCAPGPEEVLLYAVRTDIYILYLDSEDYTHRSLPLTDLKYTIAVDYDPVNEFLYWTDDEVKAIRRARLNGSDQQDVIVNDVHHPDGLAVDWVAGNLYWTDTGSDRIEVSRLNGNYRRVLVHEGLVEPRAIVVAPEHGWMFWSDWNEKQPKIERASLDGSERIVLIHSSLGWPNGLTLDLNNSKIYWCDAKIDKIEVANMDGTDRIVLTSDNLPHTFGLSLMGDFIYWTDWQRRAIDRVHKITGANRTSINDQVANVMGLKAVRLNDTRGDNPCREANGGCSQLCLNKPQAKYVCTCQMTYELRADGRTCVLPRSFILYARNQSIGRISVENGHNGQNDVVIPISGVRQASSLDFDGAASRMYWADVNVHAIFRAFINGSDTQRVVELGARVSLSEERAHVAVAVDWLAHNIYWTDAAAKTIEVARLDGSSRRALLWQGLEEPHGLALDPARGFLYWSEWGSARSIRFAALDGSKRATLASNTGHARGLTIDHGDQQLYWADLLNPAIYRIGLDGKQKKTIISTGISQPMGLTIHGNRIYWTDWSKGEIYEANKNTGEERVVVSTHVGGITDLVVVHTERQNETNQCSVGNGGCSNLCLALSDHEHTCACPTHYALHNNTCTSPTAFMLYSQRNSVVRLLPDSADYPEAVLPIPGLNRIKAVDFDPVHHYLYWIEGKTHSIKRALDNGSTVSVVVQGGANGDGAPYDLAVDALGRLLFWTCSVHDVINVTRLDNGSAVGVVVKQTSDRPRERPRLLAIHPRKRMLFWTDNGDKPRLARARLDGSQRIDMIRPRQNITAIALDLDTDMIVWAEGFRVYMCNIDGENKHSLVSETKASISQMAVYGGSMYWLERSQNQLRKLNLRSARQEPMRLAHGVAALTDLVAVRAPPVNHSCTAAHRCSHLCIGNDTSLVCACPLGLALQDDRRTCAAVPDCGRDHFTCGRNRYMFAAPHSDCIPALWRCDGHPDCQDNSDEVDCPTCRPDQFRCPNGECLDAAWVCDGTPHCADGYDELSCCSKDEFKCPRTEVCIVLSLVCDGTDNCADGADESEATCSRTVAPLPPGAGSLPVSGGGTYVVAVCAALGLLCLFAVLVFYAKRRCSSALVTVPGDPASVPLSPKSAGRAMELLRGGGNSSKVRGVPPPDLVHMSMLGVGHSQSSSGFYERCHITGASSSTNGSSLACYPRETLNPPPSPATTTASTRASSPRHRPYRHYRTINQPPPPTPCSTDVCDESDCNYPTGLPRSARYDGGPFPPPPTPRSHCHSESCPPSPSSRSSTYFSPLPPPPSPVPSPPYRGYES